MLTNSKKYKLILFLCLVGLLLTLSGCGMTRSPISSDSSGIWDHYFVYTFSSVLTFVASFFHGNYGLSIIIVTIMVRLVLLPFMLSQSKSQEKMKSLQPEMKALREKYSAKDQGSQKKLQEETIALYQRHGVNPLSIGCLPMLIQLPILLAFYYAIIRTKEIAAHNFLWFNLGHADPFFILPIVVAVSSYIQNSLMMKETVKDNPQMAMMRYVSPIMMALFSIGAPAAIPLYWFVGSVFMIGQYYLLKYVKNDTTNLSIESSSK
ncbi:OxaA-like protein precursor [Bacillus sp. SA1-12]|uniref:membrane protein insertase YidC n=1 Tax=Bacillus sp. SA1-12 TaxID=1455638 RepID=UPI0006259EFF|nr:membrane protein insertase YidC [Bacillus sp. SA1-12]KKI92027.1 OxaA-like protein precursor [Bacillus sp. SA1-12]